MEAGAVRTLIALCGGLLGMIAGGLIMSIDTVPVPWGSLMKETA